MVKSRGVQVINDHAWTDAGSSDPHKVQGDFKFLADGMVNFEYGAQVFNDTATINNVEFWLAKVNGDGSLTEIPGSRYATTVEAMRTATPKSIVSNAFSFEVKENESYRMMMRSNIPDGFYLLCTPNGAPMYYASIVFNSMTPSDRSSSPKVPVISVVGNGKPIPNKSLQYDLTTGKITVVDNP